jgi:hypothetical protein
MLMRMQGRWLWIFILALASGCSGRGDRAATYPVSGKVRQGGKPVEGVDVAFLPKKAGPSSRPARGRTDASGEFSLRTYFSPSDDAAGAVADQYTVTLTKLDAPKGMINPKIQMIDPEKQGPRKSQLPARYASRDQSDLSAAVTPSGPNRFEFNL